MGGALARRDPLQPALGGQAVAPDPRVRRRRCGRRGRRGGTGRTGGAGRAARARRRPRRPRRCRRGRARVLARARRSTQHGQRRFTPRPSHDAPCLRRRDRHRGRLPDGRARSSGAGRGVRRSRARAGAAAGDRPRVVPRGGGWGHDRRAGARSRGRGAAPARRRARGRGPRPSWARPPARMRRSPSRPSSRCSASVPPGPRRSTSPRGP